MAMLQPSRGAWAPVLLKLAGALALLLTLAGAGAASIVYGGSGVAIARGAPSGGDAHLLAPHAHDARRRAAPYDAPCDSGMKKIRGLTPDGKVILNTADVDDLVRLPGVGKRRAESIVALRERLKRFRRVSDLLKIRGIGPRALKRIEPLAVLDPLPESEPGAATDAGVPDSGK